MERQGVLTPKTPATLLDSSEYAEWDYHSVFAGPNALLQVHLVCDCTRSGKR